MEAYNQFACVPHSSKTFVLHYTVLLQIQISRASHMCSHSHKRSGGGGGGGNIDNKLVAANQPIVVVIYKCKLFLP